MLIYGFIVNFIDEDTYEHHSSHGLLIAENYTDAFKQIVNFFDEEDIIDIKLTCKEKGQLIFINSATYNEIINVNFCPHVDYMDK